jgi:hypothetical protein
VRERKKEKEKERASSSFKVLASDVPDLIHSCPSYFFGDMSFTPAGGSTFILSRELTVRALRCLP